MFQNAVVKRVEQALGAEVFVSVYVIWQDTGGEFRVVEAGGEVLQPHDDFFHERTFSSIEDAFAWVDKITM